VELFEALRLVLRKIRETQPDIGRPERKLDNAEVNAFPADRLGWTGYDRLKNPEV
jgi:hypothetical protein